METIRQTTHVSEELLEQYVLGRLPAAQVSAISDHLFECDQCNEQYEHAVNFVTAMREAAPEVRVAEEKPAPWWKLNPWSAPVWAASLAALAILFVFIPMLRQPGAPLMAELTAVRSGDIVRVPAGHSLQLRLDTTGVEAAQQVRTQVVASDGQTIWEGVSQLKDGRWQATVNRRMSAGRYWVRVFNPAGEQIREYPLIVQ